jgi:hypothetical protein
MQNWATRPKPITSGGSVKALYFAIGLSIRRSRFGAAIRDLNPSCFHINSE